MKNDHFLYNKKSKFSFKFSIFQKSENIWKNIFSKLQNYFFSMKKKSGKKIGSLDRCKIFWRIHFSHPQSDLTTLNQSPHHKVITGYQITSTTPLHFRMLVIISTLGEISRNFPGTFRGKKTKKWKIKMRTESCPNLGSQLLLSVENGPKACSKWNRHLKVKSSIWLGRLPLPQAPGRDFTKKRHILVKFQLDLTFFLFGVGSWAWNMTKL